MAIIKWKTKAEIDVEEQKKEVINIKAQLAATDYQIIKAYEYQMLGLEPPYNFKDLHAERQGLRDTINKLGSL